jgi:hypothetical protein
MSFGASSLWKWIYFVFFETSWLCDAISFVFFAASWLFTCPSMNRCGMFDPTFVARCAQCLGG